MNIKPMDKHASDKPTVRLEPEVVNETPVSETLVPDPEPVAVVAPTPVSEDVWGKFPPQVDANVRSKPSRVLLAVVILLVALTVALLGLVGKKILSGSQTGPRTVVPTIAPVATPTVPAPSPTPEITSKDKVKIQIMNGSGVTGQATKIAAALEKLDFVAPATGNASDSGQVGTVVTYSPKVSLAIVNEIVTELKKMFTSVEAKPDDALTTYHVVITTGSDPE